MHLVFKFAPETDPQTALKCADKLADYSAAWASNGRKPPPSAL